MKSIRQSQLIGLLCLQVSIHVHCFIVERCLRGCRNPDDGRCRRRRISQSNIPLHMYVIEDNHDQRPRKRFPQTRTTVQSNNNDTINRPKRPANKTDWREEWGVELCPFDDVVQGQFIDTTKPPWKHDRTNDVHYFPSTMDEVTDAAVAAIVTSLQPPPPPQRHPAANAKTTTTIPHNLDPNLIQNMVYSDNIMMSQRPVRHPQHDRGRIGIELDWSVPTGRTTSGSTVEHAERRPDFSIIRYASLLLAGKLSAHTFDRTNAVITNDRSGTNRNDTQPERQQQTLRPIAIYYNTVQEALVASRQLRQLKRLELFRRMQQQQVVQKSKEETLQQFSLVSSIYDAIHIRYLCPGDDIPDALMNPRGRHNTHSSNFGRQLATGEIDSIPHSMILIVQPTNYLDEFSPPGPLINVVDSIQRLASIAAIEQIPAVMISPRFLKASMSSENYCDQSGYYQQSSLYAGLEPPLGPTPWILRDFTPPVFCYVAHALSCRIPNSKQRTSGNDDNDIIYRNMFAADENRYSYYSHMSLWQSVLHRGHGWNLFAAIRHVPATLNDHDPQSPPFRYQWIGTSKNSAGRPTRELMRQVWSEYIKARTSR